MQGSILEVLSTMSSSLGAYLRPTRLLPLPTITNGNGNEDGYRYKELSNGVHKERRKTMSRARRILRYCLIPSIIIFLVVFWYSTREAFEEPAPPPPVKKVDPYENCGQVIADAEIPSVEEITALGLSHGSAQHDSHDQSKWAKSSLLIN